MMESIVWNSASALAAAIGQAASASGAAESSEALHIGSILDFVLKGGPTMGAIILCSLVAVTVIVERAFVLRRRAVIPSRFLASLRAVAGDRRRAIEFCASDDCPAAGILGAVLRHQGEDKETIHRSVREAGSRVLVRLRKRMRLLSSLPQVATMLGLLGTIFGMIKTFQAVAASGQSLGKTEMLAKGIFEAWTNTAAGLIVAIPTLVAYHILMGRIDGAAVELDAVAVEWIEGGANSSPLPMSDSARSAASESVPAQIAPSLAAVGA